MSPTVVMSPVEISALRTRLERDGFEFRTLQYAHFQARGTDVVVSAYRSGKVVIQGKAAETLLDSAGLDAPIAKSAGTREKLKGVIAGSDESGKGDYFGPLVVAAVVVRPDQKSALRDAGVRDCKKMADTVILRAAAAIRKLCAHHVITLDAPAYGRAHAKDGNVAIFLSRMHAQALRAAIDMEGECDGVVIDKFTSVARLEAALREEGIDLPSDIRTKAEDNPAVAAASVLARAEFLLGLKDAGNEFGMELPKGAGRPVDVVARELFEAGGLAALEKVAKTHFRTTQKVMQQEF
jgi:ribonuclease HIII